MTALLPSAVERVDKIQQPLLKQMAFEPVQRDTYRQHLYSTVLVKRTRLQVRNEEEKRMWSLVAKCAMRTGQ